MYEGFFKLHYSVKKISLFLLCALFAFQSATFAQNSTNSAQKTRIKISKHKSSEIEKTFVLSPYWENYSDDILNGYINEALNNNFTIKIAQDRIRQSQALLGTINAQRLPQLSINPSVYPFKTMSKYSGIYASGDHLYLPMLLNWELDVFGKNLDKVKSARYQVKITTEQLNITKLAISSEVAATYYNIILTNELIKNNEEILSNINETLKLKKQLYKGGIIPYDNLYLTEYEKTNKQNELNKLYKQKEILNNEFAVLRGLSPDNNENLKFTKISDIKFPFPVSAEINSDLMFNRPDILQSEDEIKKAAMDVKVARKMFLPSVNLNESVGFEALRLSRLFDWQSTVYQLGAGMLMDLYTGGYKKSYLKYNKEIATEKLHNYNNVILNAVCEVENELSSYKTDYNSYLEFQKTLKNSEHYYKVAHTRYNNGVGNKIDELDARRQYLINENSLVSSKTASIIDTVNIYKAFGSTIK
jgi:NodT family efflux transporter outer membrane factor (OMF) lipoprotein